MFLVDGAGRGFRKVESGTTAALASVFVAAKDDVWMGGAEVLHASPTGVERVALPGGAGFITDIHGLGPDDVYAVSDRRVFHFDGQGWTVHQLVGNAARVWALGPSDVWTTSNWRFRANVGYAHWDGSTWTSFAGAPSETTWMFPWDVFGSYAEDTWSFGRGDMWAVTPGGYLARKRTQLFPTRPVDAAPSSSADDAVRQR